MNIAHIYIKWYMFISCVFQGKVFLYDKVFNPKSNQEQVYDFAAKPIVAGKLIQTYNYLTFTLLVLLCLNKYYITTTLICIQGSKLGGARSPGLPWILLRLPQISAVSPKMYCFLYRTLLGSVGTIIDYNR